MFYFLHGQKCLTYELVYFDKYVCRSGVVLIAVTGCQFGCRRSTAWLEPLNLRIVKVFVEGRCMHKTQTRKGVKVDSKSQRRRRRQIYIVLVWGGRLQAEAGAASASRVHRSAYVVARGHVAAADRSARCRCRAGRTGPTDVIFDPSPRNYHNKLSVGGLTYWFVRAVHAHSYIYDCARIYINLHTHVRSRIHTHTHTHEFIYDTRVD